MAATVTNKTRKPLSVPLGRGKRLFLGPGKSGEISSHDVEQPGVKALVENGAIEVLQLRGQAGGGGRDARGRAPQGFMSRGGPRRGGDR